jgi:hypothetical protein
MRLHGRHRHLGRLGAPQILALAGITLIACSAAIGYGLLRGSGLETAMEPPASAVPAWETGAAACRDDPMVGVPHPTRFVVMASCSTVSGTVKQVRRDPADGELNLLITVDEGYARFLSSSDDGVLRAAVVPRDLPKVTVPKVGQHAALYGAWVRDRNQHHQVALHPVWGVEVTASEGNVELGSLPMPDAGSNTAVNKRLKVRMKAPRSVPVGGAINLVVRVQSSAKGDLRPEPEANLFFEVRAKGDRGVQWKAATTNALGRARVSLVALEHPESFRIWLYVDKPGRSAVVSAPVTVRRR